MENQVRCYSDISAEAFNLEKMITDTSSDQVGCVFQLKVDLTFTHFGTT